MEKETIPRNSLRPKFNWGELTPTQFQNNWTVEKKVHDEWTNMMSTFMYMYMYVCMVHKWKRKRPMIVWSINFLCNEITIEQQSQKLMPNDAFSFKLNYKKKSFLNWSLKETEKMEKKNKSIVFHTITVVTIGTLCIYQCFKHTMN